MNLDNQPNRERLFWGAALLLVSANFNLYNISFPLGYHIDEFKKVDFIKHWDQDFNHPVLMLQAPRLVVHAFDLDDPQQVAIVGRIWVAGCGVLAVLFTYLLASELMPWRWALFCGLQAAVLPILVIHAHYLKEDVVFVCFAMLSLTAFVRYLKSGNKNSLILLGVATGLAAAAQYKAVVLVAGYMAFPLLAKVERNFYAGLAAALAVAVAIFLMVNVQLFWNLDTFLSGLNHEARHAVRGHTLRITPLEYGFCFHLLYSVVPGVGVLLTLLGLASLAGILVTWRRQPAEVRAVTLFAVMSYLVIESIPLKTAPDYARYAIPLAPLLAVLAGYGLQSVWQRGGRKLRATVVGAAIASVAFPMVDSVLLDYHLVRDTRSEAARWLANQEGRALIESHAGIRVDVSSAADLYAEQIQASGARYVVTSSFSYDRYYHGARLSAQQKPLVYLRKQGYDELFTAYEFVEFQPTYRTYALSNPTIRIVDIQRRAASGR